MRNALLHLSRLSRRLTYRLTRLSRRLTYRLTRLSRRLTHRLTRLLTLIWDAPMTVIGYAVAAVLMLGGYRPTRYHFYLCFTLGRPGWGGLSMGRVILTCPDASSRLRRHELGHAIQNERFGPLMVVLTLCSAVRYHLREYLTRRGHTLPPYDAWWFEGQATRLGTAYVAKHGAKKGGENA